MRIREATGEDAAPVRALAAAAVRAGGRDHYDERQPDAWTGVDAARCLADTDRVAVVGDAATRSRASPRWVLRRAR